MLIANNEDYLFVEKNQSWLLMLLCLFRLLRRCWTLIFIYADEEGQMSLKKFSFLVNNLKTVILNLKVMRVSENINLIARRANLIDSLY
jgi:hypothetical protein